MNEQKKEIYNGAKNCVKFTSHSVNMTDRKRIVMTGICKVESSNAAEVVVSSCMGRLCITGSELKIDKFDMNDGNAVVSGQINGIKYAQAKQSLLKRIFK